MVFVSFFEFVFVSVFVFFLVFVCQLFPPYSANESDVLPIINHKLGAEICWSRNRKKASKNVT